MQKEVKKAYPDREEPTIETTPSDDIRSYRISSEKIKREINFEPKRTLEDAVADLLEAFESGKLPNSMEDIRYFNIKTLQSTDVK